MTRAEIRERYPNLINAMQNVALLSESEAVAAIVAHRQGHGCGSEAATHFCGGRPVSYLINEAKQYRHSMREV